MRMICLLKSLAACTVITSLISCATPPKNYLPNKVSGAWEAKAQIKDLANNKSYQVNLAIIAKQPASLRMDVTATLGVAVASMALHENQVQYSLYRQQKFYEGELSDRALLPLFKINMNPKLLMNICFDIPITDQGWSCVQDEAGLPESCARGLAGPKIRWLSRSGEQKRVVIEDKSFELQVVFKTFAPYDSVKNESEKNPFQLDSPKDFAKYKIN